MHKRSTSHLFISFSFTKSTIKNCKCHIFNKCDILYAHVAKIYIKPWSSHIDVLVFSSQILYAMLWFLKFKLPIAVITNLSIGKNFINIKLSLGREVPYQGCEMLWFKNKVHRMGRGSKIKILSKHLSNAILVEWDFGLWG